MSQSAQAAITNYHRLGDLKDKRIPRSSGVWEVRGQGHAGLVSGEGPTLVH